MSEHRASLRWERATADFAYETYNRSHEIRFKDGAIALPASSAPEFRGDAGRVDPEEAFVAALSGCHMLTFLAICARRRLTPDSMKTTRAACWKREATESCGWRRCNFAPGCGSQRAWKSGKRPWRPCMIGRMPSALSRIR